MAGLDPAIPLRRAPCHPDRGHLDKPGDNNAVDAARAGNPL